MRMRTHNPDAAPYIERWATTHPHQGEPIPSDEEVRAWLYQRQAREAMRVVAHQFALIDAVAAILLVISKDNPYQEWPGECSDWLHEQVQIDSFHQDCARRVCVYQFPDWLRPSLCQTPYPFKAIRDEIEMLSASLPTIPTISVEYLLSQMDFGD
jgi:hypothetical protein